MSVRFERFALDQVSFRVEQGEYYMLFGPTGSGKTLLFELIAGLRISDAGTILVNGRDLTGVDPACRRIGYVPQDLALIPFKTVWQNLAFGLYSSQFRPSHKSRSEASAEIRERVDEMLDLLKIGDLAERTPQYLSGGEKQRVALGRALVVRPDILLLDEPLSAVDERTGNSLMREIKQLQQRFKITTLHICHRLEEMRFLADRLAVICEGRLLQIGTPEQIGMHPVNDFVAELMQVGKLVSSPAVASPSGLGRDGNSRND